LPGLSTTAEAPFTLYSFFSVTTRVAVENLQAYRRFSSTDLLRAKSSLAGLLGAWLRQTMKAANRKVLFIVLSALGCLLTVDTALAGPLSINPSNPRYFTDGSGKAVYLAGSHQGWELHDNAWGTPLAFDYNAYLSLLQAHNHNLIRMWAVEHTKHPTSPAVATPMPYLRTGPGNALDGHPKFDLDQFDPDYFNRLRSRVIAARDLGIYVSIMLFQGVSIWSREDFSTHYFNISNNINGVNGDLNGDGLGFEVHTLMSSNITQRQEAYVRKVIDTVNAFDNVLYEIANEDGHASVEWQYHMINFIKSYEAGKPKQHPVGMTYRYPPGGNNSELFSSSADWISPGGSSYQTDPAVAVGSKIIIIDTDHTDAFTKDATFPWRSFLRGNSTWVIDDLSDLSLNSPYEPIRRAMGDTRRYADTINLIAMIPRIDLASTRYALANPGSEYLVYQPGSGQLTVNLIAGSYSYEWFNPKTGTTVENGAITASDGFTLFTPPFSGEAVLYLKRAEGELCIDPSPMPSGWALPCPVLIAATEPVPSSSSLTISAVSSASETRFIWSTIYISESGQWKEFTFQGSSFAGWAQDNASLTIAPRSSGLSPGAHWIAEWDWRWDPSLGCYLGPSSDRCNQGTWRMQRFSIQ
jgi:hypothetical protein